MTETRRRPPIDANNRQPRGSDQRGERIDTPKQITGPCDVQVWNNASKPLRPSFETLLAEWDRLLPYGKWTGADGRDVLFNRFYQPIWERTRGGQAKAADPKDIVSFRQQEWFYKGLYAPHRNVHVFARCLEILDEWDVLR